MLYSPKVCRLEKKCTPRTLKQWLSCHIYHHPTLSAEEIAERASVVFRFLRRYADQSQPHEIPAAKLAAICRVVGDFSAFDFLLAPHGYRVARIDGAPHKSLVEEALDVAAATGRVVETVQRLHADGHIDVHEAAEVHAVIGRARRELDELERTIPREERVRAIGIPIDIERGAR